MQQVCWNMAKYDKCEEHGKGDRIQQVWQNMTSVPKQKVCKNRTTATKIISVTKCGKIWWVWQNDTRLTKVISLKKLQVWQK